MDKVNVLIVEDNVENCKILNDFLSMSQEIVVCGISNDGKDALDKIRELGPDLVLMDFVMPELDGIEVLKELRKDSKIKMPKIIMISAIGSEDIISEASRLGVDYYLMKPYDLNVLKERILSIFCSDQDGVESFQNNNHNFSEKSLEVRKLVMLVGIPTNLFGYKYIINAVEISLSDENESHLFKDIYNKIADEHNTSTSCVDTTMRNAIEKAHRKHNDIYKELFPDFDAPENKPPSNSLFVSRIVEAIRCNAFKR